MGFFVTPKAYFGVLVFILLQPILGLVTNKMINAQIDVAGLRDVRIKKTTEILDGMKLVKLFAWENI